MKNRRVLFGLMLTAGLLAGCDVRILGAPTDVVVVGDTTPPYYDPTPTYVYGSGGRNPIIQSFTANPTHTVTNGQPITFQVVAYDPEREPLQFNWSSTGGVLSTNTGQMVIWTPPTKPGVYTVMVSISNGRGGYVMGSLNLTVEADGTSTLGGKPTSPVPTPVPPVATATPQPPSATPAPTPTPAPTATPAPSATPTPAPTTAPAGKAVIMGVVKDDSGPLADAEVVLTSGQAGFAYEATFRTGADGKYRFDTAPAGVRLVLSARKAGYGEKLRTIQALEGTESTFDFDGTYALKRL